MPADTRQLFQRTGRPLPVGRATNRPDVFESVNTTPDGNDPVSGPAAPKSKLTMVQSSQPALSAGQSPAPNGSAVSGTAANPAPSSVNPVKASSLLTRTPPSPTYRSGDYDPGSFGDQSAKANAGIYDDGTFGAQNAQANKTGLVIAPGTNVTNPISGLPETSLASIKSPPQPKPQTEAANPLTGDGGDQLAGTSAPVDPGVSLGFSRRGSVVPKGTDAQTPPKDTIGTGPATNVGGSGLFARRFSNPKSAALYHDFTKTLFGGGPNDGGSDETA